jgi:hypothetical protein
MTKKLASFVFAVAALAAVPVSVAHAQNAGVNIGTLECKVKGGIGLIITSSRDMECIYLSTSGREEYYTGVIRKYGLDVGITGDAYMIWGVFSPGVVDEGALAGQYGGASAELSAVLGAGANALVGGSNITLQPLSVQVQTGINAALGVTSMTLEPAH